MRLSPGTERMIDICLEALGSTNQTWINTATACLSRAGPAAAKATPVLMEQLQRNYHVNDSGGIPSSTARMSLDALANIGPQAAAAVPMLTRYLQDTRELYRMFGSRAYWRITGDAQTVLPILTDGLLRGKNFWAAQILGEMGTAARPAVESLRESYRTGEDYTRLDVYKALLAIDPSNPPDIQKIHDLLETENSITRVGAAEVLWEHNHDLQEVLPALIKVLPERADFFPDQNRILNIFGQMGPSASDALPAIRQILERPTGVTLTRIIASNTWAQIAPGTPIPSINTR
jgi:HEAT repeat protein